MEVTKRIDPDDRTNFKICFICYGQIYLHAVYDEGEYIEEDYMCKECQMRFLRRTYKPGVEITNTYVRAAFGLPVL